MIDYPIKRKKTTKVTNYANLGMTLESDLDLTNHFYLQHSIAVIHKKPTPIQVVNVSYPARNKAKIVEAYYKTPSTTDYNGIYKGKYIDFDAKETSSKTSMPLKNIHPHQIEHLAKIDQHGGIAFLIVHFKSYNQYFLIPASIVVNLWYKKDDIEHGRKSIPYQSFLDYAYEVKFGYTPRLDYLKIVDEVYFK
jgi:recombination protein U